MLCPGGLTTGGAELLHQLAGFLASRGFPVAMVYTPYSPRHKTPESYLCYGAPVAQRRHITAGSTVVMSETMINELGRFRDCKVVFWWLSVDNFQVVAHSNLKWIWMPRAKRLTTALRLVHKEVDLHLFQSRYAQLFLAANHFEPALRLSDYLASDFIEALQSPPELPRENLVVFNPAKGREKSAAIFTALKRHDGASVQPIPIEGMNRNEVANLLSRAKVYIDFGHHPGKDRIPREAAALGACVITNRRGSAGNDSDLSIPGDYKIDDEVPGFAERTATMIREICTNFVSHSQKFDDYRRSIAAEPGLFQQDALRIFARLNDETPNGSL